MNTSELELEIRKLKDRVTTLESRGPSLGTLAWFMVALFIFFPDLFGSAAENLRLAIKSWILK